MKNFNAKTTDCEISQWPNVNQTKLEPFKEANKEEISFSCFFSNFRELQKNLTQEWTDKSSLEIKTESKLLNTQERCNKLAKELDQRSLKLHNQLLRYGNNLYNFEFVSYSIYLYYY